MNTYIDNLFSVKGKTALVTGGAKGIGLMIAKSLVNAGATVYISSRSADDCVKIAHELSEIGVCVAMPQDLSCLAGIEALVADIEVADIERAGRGLDILVNNSGKTWGAPIDEYPEKAWDSVMELNVKSPFYLTQKLLPLLEKAGTQEDPARVINISSVSGLTPESLSAYAYGVSKAAIGHMTKVLARDLVHRNIGVNSIAPGFFPSKMTRHLDKDEARKKEALAHIPMGRMGYPEEMGALAVYLCCKASAYMTGNVIPLDGGFLVGD